jgi:hypothetical protein
LYLHSKAQREFGLSFSSAFATHNLKRKYEIPRH